jgi:hypothetical protein
MSCLARRTEIVRTTTQVTFTFTNLAGALGLACRVTKPAGSRFASPGDKDRCCFRAAADRSRRKLRPQPETFAVRRNTAESRDFLSRTI